MMLRRMRRRRKCISKLFIFVSFFLINFNFIFRTTTTITNHLVKLNFYCLAKIVSYLNIFQTADLETAFPMTTNISDVVRYKASTSSNVFDFDYFETNPYKFDINTFDYRRDLMKMIGPNVTTLKFAFHDHDFNKEHLVNLVNIVIDYFPNITKFHTVSEGYFEAHDGHFEAHDKLFEFLTNLTYLRLYSDHPMALDKLVVMTKLKTLDTAEVYITRELLDSLAQNNKDLSILTTSYSQDEILFINPENFKNLKQLTLSIKSRGSLTCTSMELPKLEKLKFQSLQRWVKQPKDHTNIGRFLQHLICVDTLRHLNLTNVSMTTNGYRQLSRFTNLRLLKVQAYGKYGHSNNITNKILRIIGGYKNLRFLIIPYSMLFSYSTLEELIKTHPKLEFLDITASRLYYTNVGKFKGNGPKDHDSMFCKRLTKINIKRKDKIRIRLANKAKIFVSNKKVIINKKN